MEKLDKSKASSNKRAALFFPDRKKIYKENPALFCPKSKPWVGRERILTRLTQHIGESDVRAYGWVQLHPRGHGM